MLTYAHEYTCNKHKSVHSVSGSVLTAANAAVNKGTKIHALDEQTRKISKTYHISGSDECWGIQRAGEGIKSWKITIIF